MSNLGLVVPHLGASQVSYQAINLANNMADAVLFFEQLLSPCVPVKCATMCVTEMVSFGGMLVTSNIENTLMAHQIANRNKIKLVFYVWDLEWLRPGKNNYLHNVKAYQVPDVLVVRSAEHVGPLANYCNRQPIIREFKQVITC